MHCSSASSGDRDAVDKLSTTFSGQLKMTSDARRAPGERFCIDDYNDDEEEEEYFSEEDLLAQMGYAKPDPNEEEEEEEEDLSEDSALTQTGYQKNERPKHEPINTPTAELSLVSALKGSRDRDEGRRADECRVSWAPDVYDPPCTSDDHFTDRNKGGGREIEGRGRGGGKGSGKGNAGGSKAGGGSKEKRKAEKKHKKRGDHGSSSKYSAHGEF